MTRQQAGIDGRSPIPLAGSAGLANPFASPSVLNRLALPARPTSHQTLARSPLITDASSASADPSPRSSRPASNASAEGWQPGAALADSSAASGRPAPGTRARSVAVKAEQAGPPRPPPPPGGAGRARRGRGHVSGRPPG